MGAAASARLPGGGRLIEEHVGELSIVRPRDSEDLIDELAFEREEFLPYWAELWPSAIALARAVGGRSLRRARTLELGCGLGLPSIAALRAGGSVLATAWSPHAVRFARANARRNGADLDAEVCSWAEPSALVARAPWDLVLGSDVLYERRNVELLLDLVPRLVGDRGEAWIADPGRPPAQLFLDTIARTFDRRSTVAPDFPSVTVHRLRRRRG
jgi:predicted nicotinamide N-methyase